MQTAPVGAAQAAAIEAAEVAAWVDLYAAAPPDFAQAIQLEITRQGPLVLTRSARIPFVHFNCVKNLGMAAPATEAALDDAIAWFHAAGIRHFDIYHHPICQPPELLDWLSARGFTANREGWDRIWRDGRPLGSVQLDGAFHVEEVDASTAEEWSGFIDATYGLPTGPWLRAAVGHPGWHHYLARQSGAIAAVRSMYVGPDGGAWFGIEAPVPGLMAPSFDVDLQICARMVRDALAMGATLIVADIEAPSAAMDTPAYANFAALGFTLAYHRAHFVP